MIYFPFWSIETFNAYLWSNFFLFWSRLQTSGSIQQQEKIFPVCSQNGSHCWPLFHKHIVPSRCERSPRDITSTKALENEWKEPPRPPLHAHIVHNSKTLSTVKVPPTHTLPRVTRGIEVAEGRYGRLLHTAVPAAWKWSYAPCQRCFVSAHWLRPLLPSASLKGEEGSLAEPREGIKGGDRVDKAHLAEAHTEEEASDWLIRHSPLASLFTEGWDPWHSPQAPTRINQPLLHLSHLSRKKGWGVMPPASLKSTSSLQLLWVTKVYSLHSAFSKFVCLWTQLICSPVVAVERSTQASFFWRLTCLLALRMETFTHLYVLAS